MGQTEFDATPVGSGPQGSAGPMPGNPSAVQSEFGPSTGPGPTGLNRVQLGQQGPAVQSTGSGSGGAGMGPSPVQTMNPQQAAPGAGGAPANVQMQASGREAQQGISGVQQQQQGASQQPTAGQGQGRRLLQQPQQGWAM